MRISTKGRYALRLMTALARADEGVHKSLKEISENQGISEKYLEQIVRPLVSEGLVESTRGSQGGYVLAASAEEITVGQVLRASEGDLSPVDCVSGKGPDCPRAGSCDTMFVWQALKDAMDGVVDGITLEDLIEHGSVSCDIEFD